MRSPTDDVISITNSIHLSPDDFQIILNQHLELNKQERTIPFAAVKRIASIIDTRLATQCATHNEKTEKIFEIIAQAFVRTNQIKTLSQNDELLSFFRTYNMHPVMITKLHQAIT